MSTITLHAKPVPVRGLRRYWQHGTGVMVYRAILKGLRVSRLNRWIEVWGHRYIAIRPWHLRVPTRAPRGIKVEEIHLDQLDELLRLRPHAADLFRERFNAGQRCFAAYLQKRCVAFMWATEGPGSLRSTFWCNWSVPARTVWLFDLYSDPGVLGAMPYLHSSIRRHLSDGKPLWLTGQVDYDNHRSLQGHSSLGYRVLGLIWTLRIGPLILHLLQRKQGLLSTLKVGVTDLRLEYFHGRDDENESDSGGFSPLEMPVLVSPSTPPQPPASGEGFSSMALNRIWLQCCCGETLALKGERYECPRCGTRLGQRKEGIPVLGPPIPYWGEIGSSEMNRLLKQMEQGNWREAVKRFLPESLHHYILSPNRAAFEDVVDFPPEGSLLEVGAGLGGISTELARKYRVVAIEGVWERTRFMALRAAQEGLHRLTVLNGDVNSIPFAPAQFDGIIVNGVLEWTGMNELQDDPGRVQVRFLERLRRLLKPGGCIYLAIENRIGWNELRGAPDHSGLPYTSLLPRFLARWVCARSARYRSAFNVGYRTYTYSYFGYRRLFRRAGLEIRDTFICPEGYNNPVRMIPLQQEAIAFASRIDHPMATVRDRMRARLIRMLGQEWFWRWTGSDFAFVLDAHPGKENA